MKLRIFGFLFLMCLNFSTILTANASKYYFESYEQSEMYADASSSESEAGISSERVAIKNNEESQQKKMVDTTKDGDVIKHTVLIKMKKNNDKKTKTTTRSKVVDEVNYKESEKTTITNNNNGTKRRKTKKRKKTKTSTSTKRSKLSFYATAGGSALLVKKHNFDTGRVTESAAELISSTDNRDVINKSSTPLLLDFSVNLRFYFYKSFFLDGGFFFKHFLGTFSFVDNVYNLIDNLYHVTLQGKERTQVKDPDFLIESTYENIYKNMLGFSLRTGISIDRVSLYVKFNVGRLLMTNTISVASDTEKRINSYSEAVTENLKKAVSEYVDGKNESKSVWSTIYGAGIGIDVNITKRFFLRLEYDHWFFKNGYTAEEHKNSSGDNTFKSDGSFGLLSFGIGVSFLGLSF